MENAADALKMAGAVLLFVLAISIIILSFEQVRKSADTIIDYKDRETFYIDASYYYEEVTGNARTVSLETMIPSLFRAYLENYKIVFENLNNPIYKIKTTYQENGVTKTETIEKRTIDLETNLNTKYRNVVLANDDQKREFLCGILYGDFSSQNGRNSSERKENFQKKFNVSLDGCTPLYEQIKNKTNITEYLGVYYQNDNPNEPNVNKTEKRVITYKIN